MTDLHQIVANSLLLLMVLLGLWGLGAAAFNKPIGGSYRSTYILAIAVFVLQDLVGIVIFFTIHQPKDLLHLIYGVAPLLALGLAYGYASDMKPRREALLMGLAALFTFGLILRAFTTGGPV